MMNDENKKWFERQGNFTDYPTLQQGNLPHCVYASIAAAVNHVSGEDVWTPQSLFSECKKQNHGAANFGVANHAIAPKQNEIEKVHHNSEWASDQLSPAQIRQWVNEGGVVILSLKNVTTGGWHMFSIMALDGDRFQVWDTNGYRGFLTDDEIANGLDYPNGWRYVPHDTEDALIIRPKRKPEDA